jgi:hypothetical protein
MSSPEFSALFARHRAYFRTCATRSAQWREVVGGSMDLPAGLALAHQRLDAMYAND